MIVTDYRNLEFYSEVPHAKEVIDFIDGFKKTEMKTGRYDILGDELFAAVSRYDTEPREDRKFESHRKYIDIQIVLDGKEELDWAETSSLKMTDNGFERGDDIAFYDGESKFDFVLTKGSFLFLLPEDAHSPCLCADKESNVKKIVFKLQLA